MGEQLGPLDQPAELFFARTMMRPLAGEQIGHNFVANLKAFQSDDPKILRLLFPYLILGQLHSRDCIRESEPRRAQKVISVASSIFGLWHFSPVLIDA